MENVYNSPSYHDRNDWITLTAANERESSLIIHHYTLLIRIPFTLYLLLLPWASTLRWYHITSSSSRAFPFNHSIHPPHLRISNLMERVSKKWCLMFSIACALARSFLKWNCLFFTTPTWRLFDVFSLVLFRDFHFRLECCVAQALSQNQRRSRCHAVVDVSTPLTCSFFAGAREAAAVAWLKIIYISTRHITALSHAFISETYDPHTRSLCFMFQRASPTLGREKTYKKKTFLLVFHTPHIYSSHWQKAHIKHIFAYSTLQIHQFFGYNSVLGGRHWEQSGSRVGNLRLDLFPPSYSTFFFCLPSPSFLLPSTQSCMIKRGSTPAT